LKIIIHSKSFTGHKRAFVFKNKFTFDSKLKLFTNF
jgi:hypothetical protein